MRKNVAKTIFLLAVLVFLSGMVLESDALARLGGGGSFGSRGSRSFSAPSRSFSSPSPSRQPMSPSPVQPAPGQQPGGGFLRGIGGGILGGLLGGMLFSSLGFGGMGGGIGGGGIGIFEILLFLGIGYFLYKMVAGRSAARSSAPGASAWGGYQAGASASSESAGLATGRQDLSVPEGLAYVRQMDPSFDEGRFKDAAMDIFFRMQGAWMNRDLSPVSGLLTDEMKKIIREDIERLRSEKRINRLENIAVRNVEISEVWQESGRDFLTVLFTANLLDYTTDETSGAVVAGNKTEPVKFEEFWTFTRPVGSNPWQLSAISQA